MGNKNKYNKKLIVIILLFSISSGLTLIKRDADFKVIKKQSLKETFTSIDGYLIKRHLEVEPEIYNFLKLDDYMYTVYEKDEINFTLYIGYYFTAEKVSSAHSPLVCFPAQGWILGNLRSHSVSVDNNKVNYAEMEAALGNTNKVLILYWFQTYKQTTTHTLYEKIYALFNRLFQNEGQNAFVRITIPLNSISREDALKAGVEFIRSFYPKFIRYIEGKY